MSNVRLISKNKANFNRKLVAIQEIGQYEDGTWQIGLRFGDGSVAQYQEKDTSRAMSFLAQIANEALAKKSFWKQDAKSEENNAEAISAEAKQEETGK